jgi:hypothetical protein
MFNAKTKYIFGTEGVFVDMEMHQMMSVRCGTTEKLDRRGKDRPHGIVIRRNLNQSGQENFRTPDSPIGPYHDQLG